MKLTVIIPAAGSSRRYADSLAGEGFADGAQGRSKLDEDLGGRPVLQRTVELFTKRDEVVGIIVAGPADPAAMDQFKLRHADKLALLGVQICAGGETHRYETVRNALALVPASSTHVAVHDAARPCATPELIDRIFDAAGRFPAVIPAVDVSDTLKRVGDDVEDAGEHDPVAAILGAASKGPSLRAVAQTIDRTKLVAVQTPQVFSRELLVRAYAQKDLTSTDDAQLIERLGERVVVIAGEATNLKITRSADLRLARAIMGFKGPDTKPAHMRF